MAEMPACPTAGPHLANAPLGGSLSSRMGESSTSLLCLSWFSASGQGDRGWGGGLGALGVTIGIAEIAELSFISPEGCVWPQFCLSSLECGIHGAPG